MTTTVEALKEIYVSLGGELTDTYDDIASGVAVGDYVTIPDISNAIAKRAASAGIELPSVSAADNGKLLTVVSGKWNKANAPKELPAVTTDDNGDILTVVSGAWAKADAPTGVEIIAKNVQVQGSATYDTNVKGLYLIAAGMQTSSNTACSLLFNPNGTKASAHLIDLKVDSENVLTIGFESAQSTKALVSNTKTSPPHNLMYITVIKLA